ncbi:MAG TPA: PxKF domain-containing protein, partial [Caldilineaceae bacterium]|nr:PxKF domain-containing protein [Caldilineaceae bacterium]
NSEAFVNGGDSAPRSRPSLAQAFQENATGARFVVDVNHLKSKGSACDAPDTGDGQGNCSLVRTNAANQLVSWLATDPTGTGESDVLIIGDLNSYAKEDPIAAIESAGYTNLVAAFVGPDAYSYVFDGQWGYLDHALGSASILDQVTGVGEWHINADEPSVLDYNTNFKTANLITTLFAPDQFRIADHDPVIIGLNLRNDPPVASAGGPYVATEGEVIMLNASGADPDGTAVTFAWDLNNDNVFETPGQSAAFAAVDGPATQTVHVHVTDETGLATVAATTVTINNVAPTVNALAMTPIPSTEGSAAVVSTTFADPGVNDAPFTCTVNYGDGSGELAGVIAGNSCTGPAHPYTTFGAYVVTVTVTDKDGDTGTNATLHSVIFNWAGFFQPVDNLPTVNVVKAGSAIPVQFSLGGNKGLAIFAPGYPQSTQIDCASGTADAEIEQTVTAGGSSLTYDAAANQYTYVWKSDKGWSNTCRQVTILLIDGTYHYASFKFK